MNKYKICNDFIKNTTGCLEVIYSIPQDILNNNLIAIICHPHPLYGGSMYNKVISTINKAFIKLGILTLRFNYRGVGKSEGKYSHGIGELQDNLSIIKHIRENFSEKKIIISGFSFGASISYNTIPYIQEKFLHSIIVIGISLKLLKLNITYHNNQVPWLIIHGEYDSISDYNDIKKKFSKLNTKSKLIKISQADHFFSHKLYLLEETIINFYQKKL